MYSIRKMNFCPRISYALVLMFIVIIGACLIGFVFIFINHYKWFLIKVFTLSLIELVYWNLQPRFTNEGFVLAKASGLPKRKHKSDY